MAKFLGFNCGNTTGCSEHHYTSGYTPLRIRQGDIGIVYSDDPITDPVREESDFFKLRKYKIRFSNGETLYTISRYRKPTK